MQIGKSATVTAVVDGANTAKAVGSGSLEVLGTPIMIALMERAACEVLKGALTAEQTSVGISINIEHTAASPVGAKVSATAAITAIDGRKVTFDLTASDNVGAIGKGTHERFIVDREKFLSKVNAAHS